MEIRFNSRVPLVVLAVLSVVLSVAVLAIWYVNIPVAAKGGHDLRFFAPVAAWLFASGIGVMLGSRIAALVLAVPPAATWVWMFVASLLEGAFLAALLQLMMSFMFLSPLVIAMGGWRLLGWLRWRAVA